MEKNERRGKIYAVPDLNKINEPINITKENEKYKPTDSYGKLGEKQEKGNITIFFMDTPDEFKIEFLEQVDTGRKIARFSKAKINRTYDFTVSALQLQHMVELKYSGYRIEHASTMQAYVKQRCRKCINRSIADSIGFSMDRKLFYNCEYSPIRKSFDEVKRHWLDLFEISEHKKIFLCSFFGLCSSFIDETIVPMVNICGSNLDIEFLRTLILSPFGDPRKGYRDYFAKSAENGKLNSDKKIVPIIVDTITYRNMKFSCDSSDYGYYFDTLGQCYAPLFVISNKPIEKDFQIGIDIPRDVFQNDKKWYRKLREAKSAMIEHSGQLSFYIANEFIKRAEIKDPEKKELANKFYRETNAIKIMFIEELEELMNDDDFSPESEKSNRIDTVSIVLRDILNGIFDDVFDDADILVGWSKAFRKREEITLYENILSLLKTKSVACNRNGFQDNLCGFLEYKNNKLYFFIQEGVMKEVHSFGSADRNAIFDKWLTTMDNSPRGRGDTQQYQTRLYVGQDNKRERFYKFCITDLENEYSEVEPVSEMLIEEIKKRNCKPHGIKTIASEDKV